MLCPFCTDECIWMLLALLVGTYIFHLSTKVKKNGNGTQCPRLIPSLCLFNCCTNVAKCRWIKNYNHAVRSNFKFTTLNGSFILFLKSIFQFNNSPCWLVLFKITRCLGELHVDPQFLSAVFLLFLKALLPFFWETILNQVS